MTDNVAVRLVAALLVPLLATGCDRLFALNEVAGDPMSGDANAPVDDVFAGDATPSGAWGAPVEVTPEDLLPDGADDPSLTSDGLQLFFEADGDIMVRTRLTTSSAWEAAARNDQLSSASADTTPRISPDGKTLYLTSSRFNGNEDLYVATRTSADGPWNQPSAILELSTVDDDAGASVTPDGLLMVFHRSQSGGDLLQASRSSPTSPWMNVTALGELNDADYKEEGPALFDDGLAIIFVSNRDGSDDLYMATRPTRNTAFSAPVLISSIATSADEDDPFVTLDGRTLYFLRDGDLMMSTR